jgi:phosphate transport system permease protein
VRRAKDLLFAGLLWSLGLGTVGVLAWLVGSVAVRGLGALSWDYLTALPEQAGRAGGVAPVLLSTLLVVLLGVALALPLALLCAAWLAESRALRWVGVVQRALLVFSSLPSLLVGLFGMALFVDFLGMRVSILVGGLTSGLMVLPTLARSLDAGLRQVPPGQRQAAAALGLTRLAYLWRVALPQALPTLGAGLALAVGRILGESAALLLTAGPSLRMPGSPLDQGRVLAYHVYLLASETPGGEPRAYQAAFLLLLVVLLIDLGASALTERAFRPRSRA